MSTASVSRKTLSNRFEDLNWLSADPLPRDRSQSHRLHEPGYLINTIDPITGNDIRNVTSHPFLVDGNLTIYFETEASRDDFQHMQLNHPNPRVPFPATDYSDRGG